MSVIDFRRELQEFARPGCENSLRNDALIDATLRFLLRVIPWRLRLKVKSMPIIGPLQRRLISMYLQGRRFVHLVDDGPARGISFEIVMPEDKGIWTGTYEFQFAKAVAAAMRGREGEAALDIGAWHGFFSGVLAANGAESVHIFEPLPTNQKVIRRLIELNPSRNLVLHPFAVGASDERSEFFVLPETSMAKLESSEFQSQRSVREQISVQVHRLDTLLKDGTIPPPAVIKMDIEGAELEALSGAIELLSQHRPILFIEVHSTALMKGCSEILTDIGYKVRILDHHSNAMMNERIFQITTA